MREVNSIGSRPGTIEMITRWSDDREGSTNAVSERQETKEQAAEGIRGVSEWWD